MQYKLMKLAAAAVLLPVSTALGQAATSAPPPPQIVTSAVGEATVVPDRATISFAVETRAATAAAAGAENARVQKAVVAALLSKGVRKEQISTAGFTVAPNEVYDKGERKVVGYVARNAVTVDVHQIDQVGPLIDAALGAGSNTIGGLHFYSTRYEEVRRQALREAVERARADAEVMAKAVGGTLGGPLEMITNDIGLPRPMMEMSMMANGRAKDAAETPIEVGEQKVSVNVTTRWLFVGGNR